MNQATTSYVSGSQASSGTSAGIVLRELVASMPIVVLFKAMRAAFAKR